MRHTSYDSLRALIDSFLFFLLLYLKIMSYGYARQMSRTNKAWYINDIRQNESDFVGQWLLTIEEGN